MIRSSLVAALLAAVAASAPVPSRAGIFSTVWTTDTMAVVSLDSTTMVCSKKTSHSSETMTYYLSGEHVNIPPDIPVVSGDRQYALADVQVGQNVRITMNLLSPTQIEIVDGAPANSSAPQSDAMAGPPGTWLTKPMSVITVNPTLLMISTTTDKGATTSWTWNVGKDKKSDMSPDIEVIHGAEHAKYSDIKEGQMVRVAMLILKPVQIHILDASQSAAAAPTAPAPSASAPANPAPEQSTPAPAQPAPQGLPAMWAKPMGPFVWWSGDVANVDTDAKTFTLSKPGAQDTEDFQAADKTVVWRIATGQKPARGTFDDVQVGRKAEAARLKGNTFQIRVYADSF